MASTEIVRKRMNREFRVKANRGSFSTLIGWAGLVELVGRNKAIWLALEALSRNGDKYTWKSRKGLRIVFYVK